MRIISLTFLFLPFYCIMSFGDEQTKWRAIAFTYWKRITWHLQRGKGGSADGKREREKERKTDRLKTEDQLSWLDSYSAWWAELQLQPSAFILPTVSFDKVQSASKRIKHWALMRKRHMRHLWMKPLGADRLIQSNVFSRHPRVFEKGVKTLKLGLNACPDPFIKPCMRALSDSKAFWLIRTLCVTSSALCHLCCFCVWKLN